MSARCTSSPLNSAVSVPGFNPRNRSASPAVSVRRGSITTMRAPRACLLASMRWNSTGWHHAALEPTSTSRSACVEILIAAGHGVGAERAAVAGDRRRHAQPRIGVDIGAADESLHQLVGDVIILGQQLPGQIERHRAGTVALDDMREAMRDMVERVAPGHPLHGALAAADHRIEQPVLKAQRFAERRAFRAQPSEIGGMFGIARYRRAAAAVGRRQHAAADAAIGTGGARGAQRGIDGRHLNNCIIGSRRLRRKSRASGRTSCRCEFAAIGSRLRISSRYQSASPTSPTSTAPARRPADITSFL